MILFLRPFHSILQSPSSSALLSDDDDDDEDDDEEDDFGCEKRENETDALADFPMSLFLYRSDSEMDLTL
jgi:hypothetical protein